MVGLSVPSHANTVQLYSIIGRDPLPLLELLLLPLHLPCWGWMTTHVARRPGVQEIVAVATQVDPAQTTEYWKCLLKSPPTWERC